MHTEIAGYSERSSNCNFNLRQDYFYTGFVTYGLIALIILLLNKTIA